MTMSLKNVLDSVINKKNDMCLLCFQDTQVNVYMTDEVVVDEARNTRALSEILSCVLNDQISTVSIINAVCTNCKEAAINSYKFIKMCTENSNQLEVALDCVSDSCRNTFEDNSYFKTLFVSINTNDFNTKKYYWDKIIKKTSSALKAFKSLHCDTKPEVKITDEEAINLLKVRKKLPPINYDIPTIPTKTLIVDKYIGKYTCKICLKSYIDQRKLRCHYFRNHYPKTVKCNKCAKAFISKDLLQRHNDVYHTSIICKDCGKCCSNRYILKKHEKNHNLTIICQQCGRVYRSNESYKQHIAQQICEQKLRKSSIQGELQCDYCSKKFCHKPYLAKHIRFEHEKAKGFICMVCNKNFYTRSLLNTHMLKHTREKNFVCNQCGNRFVTKTSLLYHTRLHTGERPYQCDYCDKAFLSASRRMDHMRRHHLEPALECDICHVKFKATGSLLKHKKRHSDPNSRLNISRHFI